MGKPILYFHLASFPARTAYMLAKYIGLDFEEREVKLFHGETETVEYRRINPAGTVPTFIDGDFIITDSHAIIIYLVEKYAKTDNLYPKTDLKLRTKINQVLFYEASYLFAKLFEILSTHFYKGDLEVPDSKKQLIERGYTCVETMLKDSKFIAADQLTLADFSVWSLLEASVKLIPVPPENYPKMFAYLENMRQVLPFKDLMAEAIDGHLQIIDSRVQKRNAELN